MAGENVKVSTRISRVEPGIVEDVTYVENRPVVYVKLENPNSPSSSGQVDALVRCVYVNPFGHDGSTAATSGALPAKGTRCLVLIDNLETESGAYYLGSITDPYSRKLTPPPFIPGSLSWKSETGNGFMASAGNEGVSIFAADASTIRLTKDSLAYRNAALSASMLIDSSKMSLVTNAGSLTADDASLRLLSTGGMQLAAANGAMVLRADRGLMDFSGGTLESKSETFRGVYGQKIESAGIYKLKVLNGAAFVTGDATSWETFIVMGNAKTILGDGSSTTTLYDSLFSAKYRVEIGVAPSPTVTYLEMDKSDVKLYSNGVAPTLELRADQGGTGLAQSSLKLEPTSVDLVLKTAGMKSFDISAGVSDSSWTQYAAGTKMATWKLKAAGESEHEVMQSITMKVSPSPGVDMAKIEMKLSEMILEYLMGMARVTVGPAGVHSHPDLVAGTGPASAGAAAFPANLSLRMHGHLTLLGPTITKVPSDVIPI